MIEYSQTLIGRTIIGSPERGSKSFDKLLEICHSIFPDELQAILDGMVIAKLIQKNGNEYVLDNSIPNRWIKTQTDWQENLNKRPIRLYP